MEPMPHSELLRCLLSEAHEPKRFEVTDQMPREPGALSAPADFIVVLGVAKDGLFNVATATLDAIEELERTSDSHGVDFKWELTVLAHVQGIFDVTIQQSADPVVCFQQYDFCYESRLILAESVLAGLNGLYIASVALLRPFLKFTLLQNYYYQVIRTAGSYAPVEQYLSKGKHPSWSSILQKAVPYDVFCRPIRFRLQAHLTGLSESSVHPYHPDFSPVQHGKSAYRALRPRAADS
jgi:hypothetical protein